jgi:eukaryotic-like serine/threonine-protein kinase
MHMGAVDQITEVAGYRLAERIGSGGMGDVYKAYNDSLGRVAAVKILYADTHADRFQNEAYIQSTINHPNIARLYEYCKCGDKHCIVMEFVEGECLDKALRRKKNFSSIEVEEILSQIVSALAYLHKKEIIHRDIKPQNFKIQADGTVKMLDFGIAKHKYSPKFTQTGFIVGTTEYLAPEQFQQQPELKSDIWALGVMAYELLTGYMPFEGGSPLILQAKIRKGEFTNPKILIPGISLKLAQVIEKCLKVNPANRISATGIGDILGKKRTLTLTDKRFTPKKMVVPGIAAFVVILSIVFYVNSSNDPPGVKTGVTPPENNIPVPGLNEVIINTPGVEHAELILESGVTQALPYAVKGKEGETVAFTIRAEGYEDREVQVVVTPRRLSYEFNLEKKQ